MLTRTHYTVSIYLSPRRQGLPGKTVSDWLRDAKGRLLVEQAVRAMSARSALLNSSLI